MLVSLSRAVFLPVHLFREYRAARRLVRDQRRSDFDRAYDVDTDGDFGGWTYLSDLSIPSPNWIHGNNYTGIDPERFSGILAGVTIKFEDLCSSISALEKAELSSWPQSFLSSESWE